MGKENKNTKTSSSAIKSIGGIWSKIPERVLNVGKKIIDAPIDVPIETVGIIIRKAYAVFDETREFIHNKKMERKAKREAEAKMLNEQFKEQNEQIQYKQSRNSQHFADSFGDDEYDIETANAYEIRKMSQEFDRIRNEFKESAEIIEKKTTEFVQDSIRDMIKDFEEINSREIGTLPLNLNISYMKELENRIERNISGFIQNNVKRNLSIDNEECANLLKIKGKLEKEEAMKKYQNKIINDALKRLWDTINDSISSENEMIYNQITTRLSSIEKTADEKIRHLEEIKKAKEMNEEQMIEKQSEFNNMIDITSWCIDMLNRERII